MKLIKKVSRIEVKRSFVFSQMMRGGRDKRRVHSWDKVAFRRELVRTKARIKKFKEADLDRIVGRDKKRLRIYDSLQWHLGIVNVNEVGVWKRAGGLPLAWTKGSLKETAHCFLTKTGTSPNARAARAIRGILDVSIHYVQSEHYLFPIILPGGTRGRKDLKRMKGDIDDGCMRALALAVSGKKAVKAYIGFLKT